MGPVKDHNTHSRRSSEDVSAENNLSATDGNPLNSAQSQVDDSQPTNSCYEAARQQSTISSRRESLENPAQRMSSPRPTDRVYPIRSTISVDPTATPFAKNERAETYFQATKCDKSGRRSSTSKEPIIASGQDAPSAEAGVRHVNEHEGHTGTTRQRHPNGEIKSEKVDVPLSSPHGLSVSGNIIASKNDEQSKGDAEGFHRGTSDGKRVEGVNSDDYDETLGKYVTSRFKHIVTEEGHAVITGRGGETLQRCEDEPIHVPGAIQSFGMLIALRLQDDDNLTVRVVSENSKRFIGYTPKELFALTSFCDILAEEQADNLLDHIDYVRDDSSEVAVNGPEVFTLSLTPPQGKSTKFWCAVHASDLNANTIICELEFESDNEYPLQPLEDLTPDPPEDTLNSQPTAEEFLESTKAMNRPLRILRGARKRKGEVAAMEVFNVLSQVQEQLAGAPNLEAFLGILVGVVKELTGFHRVMVYQFDKLWNGKVVTELVDARATKDLYKGLHFPASDIPKQARDLYRINKVRLLYDRDLDTARLVCKSVEDLETPLDLTHSYLRAMSPIHLKYLANMAVRSSMSISINAFGELWGLIACHSYGSKGRRVSFPTRKMCRMVGDAASFNIERLSFASRLQARKLINTMPSESKPSGYIIASSEDLLQLFDADVGVLAIHDETKILGQIEETQELLALAEYLRMKRFTSILSSHDVNEDFLDLSYGPGFKIIVGLLVVPLSTAGQDFIAFFRKAQAREVKWAGNPYEKYNKEGTEGYLEPRNSFATWSERIEGKSREWTEDKIETAAILCLVYGKFIEVWRQKEAALKNTQLTRLLLSNSAHEVRTPLNAIINYLEIALEGPLDRETHENLTKSHSASKSLIYVINDLLDLTKAEQGVDLMKWEVFELKCTLSEVTLTFERDAKRKGIGFEVNEAPDLPKYVVGDQRKVRQAVSNVVANAIQNTSEGSVAVNVSLLSRTDDHASVEVAVHDTGCGMSTRKLDALFRDLEQVQLETSDNATRLGTSERNEKSEGDKVLGLGLAVVARTIHNMGGQLRVQSEEGKGSRFAMLFRFELPSPEALGAAVSSSPLPRPTSSHVQSHEQPGPNLNIDESAANGSGNPKLTLQRGSTESLRSLHSAKSRQTGHSEVSIRSNDSDVDRLINAIKEPHLIERTAPFQPDSRPTSVTSKGIANQLRNGAATEAVDQGGKRSSRSSGRLKDDSPFTMVVGPGERLITDSGVPLKAVRVASDDEISPVRSPKPAITQTPTTEKSYERGQIHSGPGMEKPISNALCVLVAEDDPVNSKIMKKRLEKAGHEVFLTGNGEECASAYGEKAEMFDIVLMDMQVSYKFLILLVFRHGLVAYCNVVTLSRWRCPTG